MRYYQNPRLVYRSFSHENILTASEPQPEKTDLNAWLRDNGVQDSGHVVVNMNE
ncbi:MAG: hypothetical protein IJH37_08870 [Clostridia bacterium]|nr:hypothetical protein [Clostridia bacterium]